MHIFLPVKFVTLQFYERIKAASTKFCIMTALLLCPHSIWKKIKCIGTDLQVKLMLLVHKSQEGKPLP
jgi:hypothetical protein